ncbi:MAG: DUF1295 domain-containing protein [Pseudomonadota bacterium]
MECAVEYATILAWSLGGFLILWPISLLRRDASVVDFWWGPGQGVVAAAAWLSAGMPGGLGGLIFGCVALWAVRLGLQLGRRRVLEGQEDPRYTALRRHWNPGFWWKSLFIVFLLQCLLQCLIALGPIAAIRAGDGQIGLLAAIGFCAWLVGMGLEIVADIQLDLFRRRHGHGALLTAGLRGVVRYPHYLGEVLVWWGVSLMAVAAGIWWAPLGAGLVTLLIWKVSGVPFLDAHMSETRAAFMAYARRVPALLPKLRREILVRGAETQR